MSRNETPRAPSSSRRKVLPVGHYRGLGAWTVVFFVFLYLPIVVLVFYSFNANRLEVMTRIVIPLCKPGIIAGCILVFIPCLGAFIAPNLLGGGKKLMLGSLVQFQFASARNWPFGAALSMLLLSAVVIVLIFYARSSRKRELEEGGA